MPNFIISRISLILNSVKETIWPRPQLKRRRDSIEEEEESDVFESFQAIGVSPEKRPRFITSPVNMESDEDVQYVPQPESRSSELRTSRILASSSYNQRFKTSPAVKGHDSDVVITGSYSAGEKEIRSRALVGEQSSVQSNGATPRHHHQHERAKSHVNGVRRSNSFTSSLRHSSKHSTPKMTAIEQANKIDERNKYSQMLTEFMSNQQSFKPKPSPQSSFRSGGIKEEIDLTGARPTVKAWKSVDKDLQILVENGATSRSDKNKFSNVGLNSIIDVNERMKESRGGMLVQMAQSAPRKTQIVVAPWRYPAADATSSRLDPDPTPMAVTVQRINSMERKLANTPVAQFSWIRDLQKRYSDKEVEKKKQLEAARLTKDIYAKHNEEKSYQMLDDRIRRHLKITEVVLEDVEEIPVLPQLTKDMNAKIDWALRPHPPSEVLVEDSTLRIRMTRGDIQTLNKLNWLNDEVINAYMTLINERGKKENYVNVYAFSTFFYPKLASQGYTADGLGRWTKRAKVDIFSKQMVLVPIHLGIHWCMATIDFRNQKIEYYDSMGKSNNKCLDALLMYINEEHKNKKNTPYDTSNWITENVKEIPQQMNGSDCGVFSCMFAEYLSRNARLTFSQKDMPYMRRKMVYEILTKKLLQ